VAPKQPEIVIQDQAYRNNRSVANECPKHPVRPNPLDNIALKSIYEEGRRLGRVNSMPPEEFKLEPVRQHKHRHLLSLPMQQPRFNIL
jgi:hypothetical protein